MRAKGIIIHLVFAVVLIGGYAFSHSRIAAHRSRIPPEAERAEALMISPAVMKVLAGEFSGLWADYLLLKASVFLGGYRKSTPEDWETLYVLFKQSLALDSYFFQTCYYVQGQLVWRESVRERALALLEQCAERRSWDWEPRFYLGFDYFYLMQDYDRAARYLGEAAEMPGAPTIVGTLAARMAHRAGRSTTAIALLRVMHDREKDERLRETLERRIAAHTGVYVLEQAVSEYERRFGKRPASLEELTKAGILQALPENPFGDAYIYDPGEGRVYFDKTR